MVCRAGLASDTLTRKAQRILTANGYHSEIIRSTKMQAEGCGFGLRIIGDCAEIRALLRQEGIEVRSMKTERGSA